MRQLEWVSLTWLCHDYDFDHGDNDLDEKDTDDHDEDDSIPNNVIIIVTKNVVISLILSVTSFHLCIKMPEYDFQHKVKISDES